MDGSLFLDFSVRCFLRLLVNEHTVLIIAALEYDSISVLGPCLLFFFRVFLAVSLGLLFFFFQREL